MSRSVQLHKNKETKWEEKNFFEVALFSFVVYVYARDLFGYPAYLFVAK
jgi:hypothetical protein